MKIRDLAAPAISAEAHAMSSPHQAGIRQRHAVETRKQIASVDALF